MEELALPPDADRGSSVLRKILEISEDADVEGEVSEPILNLIRCARGELAQSSTAPCRSGVILRHGSYSWRFFLSAKQKSWQLR